MLGQGQQWKKRPIHGINRESKKTKLGKAEKDNNGWERQRTEKLKLAKHVSIFLFCQNKRNLVLLAIEF